MKSKKTQKTRVQDSKKKVKSSTNDKKKSVNKTKVRRKRHIKVIQMDQLYKIINKVQLDRKPSTISVEDPAMCPVIENVLNDIGIAYKRVNSDETMIYTLIPNEAPIVRDIDVDELEDEMVEHGQLF